MNALALVSRGYLFSGVAVGGGASLISNMAPETTGDSDVPHVTAEELSHPRTLVRSNPELVPVTRPGRKRKR